MRRVCYLITAWMLACGGARAQAPAPPTYAEDEATSLLPRPDRREAPDDSVATRATATAYDVRTTSSRRELALAARFEELHRRELALVVQRRSPTRRRRITLGFVFGGLATGVSYFALTAFALAHADGPPTPGERAGLLSVAGLSGAAAIAGFATALVTLIRNPYRAESRELRRERREVERELHLLRQKRELHLLRQERARLQLRFFPSGAAAHLTF